MHRFRSLIPGFLLLAGCVDLLGPSMSGLRPNCSTAQACPQDWVCHKGRCLDRVERCDGNGQIGVGEVCDDGNSSDTDACTNECKEARCGDGITRQDIPPGQSGHEACDDGNEINDDGCLNGCVLARCGDGVVRSDLAAGVVGSEDCDDLNGDFTDACTNDCKQARCGDGIVRTDQSEGDAAFEACDDGDGSDTNICTNQCTVAVCGDGIVHAGVEACDDGNDRDDDGCRPDCTVPRCGDGRLDSNEDCDDGNGEPGDDCTNRCTVAICGDGALRTNRYLGDDDYEACDDGNSSDDDACVGQCMRARCGDGFVRSGIEQCDDANWVDDDDCANSCGSGFIAIDGTLTRRCAVSEAGDLYCWGSNAEGFFSQELPILLLKATRVPGFANLTDVCVAQTGFCVLNAEGVVACAGQQGGTRSILASSIPDSLRPNATQIVCAGSRACTTYEDGSLTCWGVPYQDANDEDYFVPAGINSVTNVRLQRIADGTATCVTRSQGLPTCWGDLPAHWRAPTSSPWMRPIDCVLDQTTRKHCVNLSGGRHYYLLLNAENNDLASQNRPWGVHKLLAPGVFINRDLRLVLVDEENIARRSIQPSNLDLRTLDAIVELPWFSVDSIAWGCRLDWRRQAACWGPNRFGQIGNGNSEVLLQPTPQLRASGSDWMQMIAGEQVRLNAGQLSWSQHQNDPPPNLSQAAVFDGDSGCVLDIAGQVYCHGNNSRNGLGLGAVVPDYTPHWHHWPIEERIERLALNEGYGCYRTTAQELHCFGHALVDHQRIDLSGEITDFAVATSGACAVVDGGLSCWGQVKPLRLNQTSDAEWAAEASNTRPRTLPHTRPITDVGIGSELCVIDDRQDVFCHGPEGIWQQQHELIGATQIEGIVTTGDDALGNQCVLAQGQVWCWGDLNDRAQLGTGAFEFTIDQPQRVQGIDNGDEITVTHTNGCARIQRDWVCWGRAQSNPLSRLQAASVERAP